MKKQKMRRYIAGVLTLTMLLSCLIELTCVNRIVLGEEKMFNVEQIDIGEYASTNKAPKPTNSQYKDWLFAGWYEDPECTEYIFDKTGMSGMKYAKYVPAEVLSMKSQNLLGTSESSDTTNMRVVTTVDSLLYREVGIDVRIGKTTNTIPIKKVYKKIAATTGGVPFSYEPTVFSYASKYFATVTLTNIPNKGFGKGISMIPYWITPDGTKVYGVGRYARVEDSWKKVLNIPVRLYTDEMASAGLVKVNYNKDEYKYIGTDTSDIGNVFTEMYVQDNGNGIVSCVGNSEPIGDVAIDGMMVNLRFEKIGTSQEENVNFSVTGEEFVEYNGNDVSIDVSDIIYHVVTQ